MFFRKLGSIILLSETLIKSYENFLRNSLFVSGQTETVKIGLLLLPTLSSMTPQKKPAAYYLLCHLLKRPPQVQPVGFINKGNMKYGNSFLHILSAVPLQQSPFRIKHVIACVANYQSQHGLKKKTQSNSLTYLTFYGL